MSYNSSVNVCVLNDAGGTANIQLSSQYSDDSMNGSAWTGVAYGQTTSTVGKPLTVPFNTGSGHPGTDYWFCSVTLTDGPNAGKTFQSEGSYKHPKKACMLEKEDNAQNLTFTVTTSTFVMALISGPCTTGMSLA